MLEVWGKTEQERGTRSVCVCVHAHTHAAVLNRMRRGLTETVFKTTPEGGRI